MLSLAFGSQAQAVVVANAVPEAGPALGKTDVAWAEARTLGGQTRVFLVRKRPQARAKAQLTPDRIARGENVEERATSVVESGSYIALGRTTLPCYPNASCANRLDVVFGRIGSPLAFRVADDGDCQLGTGSVDLAGRDLVYDRATIRKRRCIAQVVVRDLGAARARGRVLASAANSSIQVRAAGHLVAWLMLRKPDVIVVYDLRRRAVLYRAFASAADADEFRAWDVQADGKIAVAIAPRGAPAGNAGVPLMVDVFSPRRAQPDMLPIRADGDVDNPELHIDRDRVALMRAPGRHSTDLVVIDLAGNVRTVARFSNCRCAGGPHRWLPTANFDLRAVRVAWAAQRIDRVDSRCGRGPCQLVVKGPTRIFVSDVSTESDAEP